MEKEIKEKALANVPKSIPVEVLNNLVQKGKTNICKIQCSKGGFGTGFFCKISYNWDLILKVLITSNHLLNKEDLMINKTIKFSINNEKQQYKILIVESRKIYTNDKYDITIIELKEKDKINENYFFDIDNEIFNENSHKIFINKDVFLLHYANGEMRYSNGIINYINEDNNTIHHSCSSNIGSLGGPIINSINCQVIGFHRGACSKKYNLGTFLKEPINKFIDQVNKSQNKLQSNIIKNDSQENKNIEHKKKKNKNVDEITILYKIKNIKNSKSIRIFGDEFVKNNKDKCKIIINGKEIDLCSHINININKINNNKIYEIKLNGINSITNMSCMFKGDTSNIIPLSSLPDISKWDTKNVNDMSYMFYLCSLLSSLSDISKWNTKNVINMSYMFYGCSLLSFLPDISKWNTQNVTNMSYMFYGCSLLSSYPDISKWNTQNVTNKSNMFLGRTQTSANTSINKEKKLNMRKSFNNNISLLTSFEISKYNLLHNNIIKSDDLKENKKKSKEIINKNVDEITILYKIKNIKNKKSIRIFGEEFVKNNKDKCKIIINGKEIELCSYINININKINNNKIYEIKLNGINSITNMSRMFINEFDDEIQLLSLPDISNLNTKNIIDMSYMFYGCSSLSSLPDFSKWNTQNVTNMSFMFYGCSSLSYLPDISGWDTKNVINISNLFYGCSSLLSLPDISKWNTKKIINMSNMFNGCSGLLSLPDISKWNTPNANNMKGMFNGCSGLLSLPNISKWNTKNVIDISLIFCKCSSLLSLPDISKWNTQNVIIMSGIFSECSSLLSLPDISKWNTQNVTDMSFMFNDCSSLSSLPDISKWNTQKVNNKNEMFKGTKNLNIPKEFQEGCIIF